MANLLTTELGGTFCPRNFRATEFEGVELLCGEDGLRDIARIKIAQRCEGEDQTKNAQLAIPEQGAGGLTCELLCAAATEFEGVELICDEDGLRDIARIKIARRCEGEDQTKNAQLAIPEQGAGGLDCELLWAPAAFK